MPKQPRITKELIERVSNLAMLELSEGESSKIARELAKILEYFRKLDEVDTGKVPPTYHVVDLHNVAREDEPISFDSEELLKLLPMRKERYAKAARMV